MHVTYGLSLWSGLLLSACASTPSPRIEIATLKVDARPENTRVYVDGQFAGRAAVLRRVGKAMRPGVKYVTFVAPGHFPHDVRLDVKPGETVVKLKLRPIPP